MQKILIIDDEVHNLRIITELIMAVREKSEIYQTANSPDALWKATEKQPDLIMLDWSMPDITCVELINKFKTTLETQNTPIIILTDVSVSLTEIEEALQAGAIDYLRKPIDEMELLARVNAGLKLSRLYQAIRKSEQMLHRQRQRLDDLSREQNQLMAIVSHDLRSPLNKALGLLQFLPLEGDLNEAQRADMKMIENVLEGGRKLIDDLLTISVKEADMSKLEMRQIDITDWAKDMIATFIPTAEKKNIKLHLKAPEVCLLQSNEENLNRILDNLLSNAIKFSYPEKNIYLDIEVKDDRLCLSVRDEGQGISSEDQKLMFRKFQKLQAKPTGDEQSTGLGLSIIKTLVTQLQGEIRVQSEVGVGTTFHILLPLHFNN